MPKYHLAVVTVALLTLGHSPLLLARPLVRDGLPERTISAKIANGIGAVPGQFAFAAALHAGSPTDGGLSQYCGGALVADNMVLTAAHCLIFSEAGANKLVLPAHVRVGATDASDPSMPSWTVLNAVIHPLYDNSNAWQPLFYPPTSTASRDLTLPYDVALLQLDRAVPPDFARPVELAAPNTTLEEGEELTVIGFGTTPGLSPSRLLLHTALNFVPLEVCAGFTFVLNGQELYFPLHDTMLCAGSSTSSNTCPGDSGGALINEAGELVGVASFATHNCGGTGMISGYASVMALASWIAETIEQQAVASMPPS